MKKLAWRKCRKTFLKVHLTPNTISAKKSKFHLVTISLILITFSVDELCCEENFEVGHSCDLTL